MKDSAPACGGQLDGRRDRARARAPWRCRLGHGDLAGGILDAARTTLLSGLARRRWRVRRAPARPALEALARTRAGRTALLWQTFGRPTRMPGEVVVQTLREAWAAPAFADALAAFDRYTFHCGDELARTPLTIAWGNADRLLPYRPQAPRARALLAHARPRDAGRRPRALLRRSAGRRRGDPRGRRLPIQSSAIRRPVGEDRLGQPDRRRRDRRPRRSRNAPAPSVSPSPVPDARRARLQRIQAGVPAGAEHAALPSSSSVSISVSVHRSPSSADATSKRIVSGPQRNSSNDGWPQASISRGEVAVLVLDSAWRADGPLADDRVWEPGLQVLVLGQRPPHLLGRVRSSRSKRSRHCAPACSSLPFMTSSSLLCFADAWRSRPRRLVHLVECRASASRLSSQVARVGASQASSSRSAARARGTGAAARPPAPHEAGVAQDSQMLGHRRLTDRQAAHEIADGLLALAQQVENAASVGLRETSNTVTPHTLLKVI